MSVLKIINEEINLENENQIIIKKSKNKIIQKKQNNFNKDLDEITKDIKNIKLENDNLSNTDLKKQINLFEDKTNMDKYWTHILKILKYDFNSDIGLKFTADDIKKCRDSWEDNDYQFEPRLLCKIDSLNKRPQIFKKYNLSLISMKNGMYYLMKDSIYHEVNKIPNTKIIKLKKDDDDDDMMI